MSNIYQYQCHQYGLNMFQPQKMMRHLSISTTSDKELSYHFQQQNVINKKNYNKMSKAFFPQFYCCKNISILSICAKKYLKLTIVNYVIFYIKLTKINY